MVTRGRERKGGLSNLLHLAFARLFGLGWGVFRTIMAAIIYSDDRDIYMIIIMILSSDDDDDTAKS